MSTTYSYQVYDLDLDKLDKEDDPTKLPQLFSSLAFADNDFKILAARQWIENFLYYCGMKEFYSASTSSTIVGNSVLLPNRRSNIKKRHTAKVFKAIQVQAANISKQRPTIKVWPESDEERAEKKAKLSNILLDYFWEKDNEDDYSHIAVLWALMTPVISRKDFIDYSFGKSRLWPQTRKVEERDEYGLPTGRMIDDYIVDSQGRPILEQHPKHSLEMVSSYRLIFNPHADWVNGIDYVGDFSVKRIGWIRDNYLRHEEGYFPANVEDLKPGAWSYTPLMAMEMAIKQLAFGTNRVYRNFNYSNLPMKDGVIMGHFFIQPSHNYPEGREIVVANGLTLYDGKSREYVDGPSEIWHPHSFLTYERVPSRLWGTTYAEKIVDINKAYDQQRSELDKLRRTFTKPKMTMPTGSNIERDTVTGDEEVYRYNPYGADGGKPSYLVAPQPPTTLIDDIKLTKEDFTEISGVTEIMMGIRPQGVTTYRGLEVLREEANNIANPFIRMFENFLQRSQTNKLNVLRKTFQMPDQNMVQALKIFKKMNHYVTDLDIQSFVGDDLAGYVKIEPHSTIAKSKLAMQAKFESMAQLGILGDIVNDPDLNAEYKRKMDVMGFDTPQNKQVMFQRYENQMMLQADKMGQVINPPVMEWHDDPVHIREIEQLLLDVTLQSQPLTIQSLQLHRQGHMEKMAALMAQQAQQAMSPVDKQMGMEKPGMPQTAKQTEGTLFGDGQQGFATGEGQNLA